MTSHATTIITVSERIVNIGPAISEISRNKQYTRFVIYLHNPNTSTTKSQAIFNLVAVHFPCNSRRNSRAALTTSVLT